MIKGKQVYLDNAATTKMLPEAIDAVVEAMRDTFGNPSGMYGVGFESKSSIDKSRQKIAETISADPAQIFFTSGGTEGDNWIIKGVAEAQSTKGHHIVTSSIEHKAVLKSCGWLEQHGYEVTYVEPDSRGFIHVSDVESAIREDTILVSIMYANNEIGTIQPIQEIAEVCKNHQVLFHTDAVQAYCHVPINVGELGVDFLTTSAHKFHGPNGVGFAYIKDPSVMLPLIHGGQQEHGLRAGTENVPGIVGMGVAAEVMHRDLTSHINYMGGLRDHFIERVLNEIKGCSLNGSLVSRLCNNISLSFDGIHAEEALVLLDMGGISCSSGSACNSEDNIPSHVVMALGHSEEYARSTLRFTISAFSTLEEIDYAISTLKTVVSDLRGC